MKSTVASIALAVLAAKASATCWSTTLGYPCCSSSNTKVWYTDSDGDWGVEKKGWCGIPKSETKTETCWSLSLGYSCCEKTNVVVYTDNDGKWGVENGNWCGIDDIDSDEDEPILCCRYTTPSNPFRNKTFYLNPYYYDQLEKAIDQMSDESLIKKAEKLMYYPTAIWLDSIEYMNNWLERHLKTALVEQNAFGNYVLTVFVVYDLPGRDCHSLASYGELLPNDDDMERYKTEYINVIEKHLNKYKSQPVVLVIEPFSLVNLVVYNDTLPACVDAKKYYLEGHAYLLKRLGTFPHVALYLDAGCSYWMNWEEAVITAARLFSDVIKSGYPGKIRGFATNVANHSPWEDLNIGGPDYEWNPYPDESSYIKGLYIAFKAAGIQSVHFIEDTSRNGNGEHMVHHRERQCNPKGVGIGARPQADPIPEMDYIDAFYWIKPFGISDGTTDPTSEHYDGKCDYYSMNPAPEAGEWFQEFFEEGLKNANPPL